MSKLNGIGQLHLTADKREIKDFPKLPPATSFIRETLAEVKVHVC